MATAKAIKPVVLGAGVQWVILRPADRKNYFLCRCSCGEVRNVQRGSLQNGNSKTCGHLIVESATKHGMYKTRAYKAWTQMKTRCLNPEHDQYSDYGGRGITVCERWKNSFELFYADMGDPPLGKSLDRYPDNDAGYSPENCRWATVQQQARNRRSTRMIEFEGEPKCLSQWASELGLSKPALAWRIKQWGVRRALQTTRRDYPKG